MLLDEGEDAEDASARHTTVSDMADQTPTRIHVELGALCPPLHEQLGVFGVTEAEPLQIDANAIVRLSVRGLLSEAEETRARKRLVRKIQAFINERDDLAVPSTPSRTDGTSRHRASGHRRENGRRPREGIAEKRQ